MIVARRDVRRYIWSVGGRASGAAVAILLASACRPTPTLLPVDDVGRDDVHVVAVAVGPDGQARATFGPELFRTGARAVDVGGYHFDEELKCTAMPAECLDEYADNWGWCDCLAYASCPWCDWDGFATVEDCTDQSIVVDWEEEALPPI